MNNIFFFLQLIELVQMVVYVYVLCLLYIEILKI